jgi:hypothetical protein
VFLPSFLTPFFCFFLPSSSYHPSFLLPLLPSILASILPPFLPS